MTNNDSADGSNNSFHKLEFIRGMDHHFDKADKATQEGLFAVGRALGKSYVIFFPIFVSNHCSLIILSYLTSLYFDSLHGT